MRGPPNKLLRLQAARAIAANLVVLAHLDQFESKYASGPLSPFTPYAQVGVDLFFVLSGFIMVAVAGHNIGPVQFLWRRITRIYPTYWLASLVMLGVAAAMPGLVHESFKPISIWRSFLLVPDTVAPIVAVGSTLINEMYFYAVFAILLAFRIPPLAGVLVWIAAIVGVTLLWPQQISESPILHVVTSPLTLEFIMGIIVGVAWLKRQTPFSGLAGIAGLIILLCSIPAHYYLIYNMGSPSLIGSPNFESWRVILFGFPLALILYALVSYESSTSARSPPALLVAIGDWSYSIYLFHFMILSAVGRSVLVAFPDRGRIATIILFIIGFTASNLGGAAVYYLFERPALRLFRKSDRSPSIAATSP